MVFYKMGSDVLIATALVVMRKKRVKLKVFYNQKKTIQRHNMELLTEKKMRIDTRKTEVFPFDELSDEVKQTVIEKLFDINVNYDWWESIFEDAKTVSIKITGFDIDRGSYCHGDIGDAEETAELIIKNHGKDCKTWNTANEFIAVYEQGKKDFENSDDYDPDYEEFSESDYCDEVIAEFKRFILEDYRIILQGEYEHMTGEEAIIETIEANEYEFTEDGKIYS